MVLIGSGNSLGYSFGNKRVCYRMPVFDGILLKIIEIRRIFIQPHTTVLVNYFPCFRNVNAPFFHQLIQE